MSIALADALEDVELVEGQTYHCQVHGRQIEVRVLTKSPSSGLSEDDVMLDAWTELPEPQPMKRGRVRRGVLPPPSVPDIPEEGEMGTCSGMIEIGVPPL